VGHYYETSNLHSRETKLCCSLWPGQSLSFVSPFNSKIKQITSLKKNYLIPQKNEKCPQTPLHPFYKNPSIQKMPKIVKCTFFHQPLQLWKSFLGMLKKTYSLGETGTTFSHRVKVQDLKTCKSKYLATWFSAFCLVSFDTCHVTHSCPIKKSTWIGRYNITEWLQWVLITSLICTLFLLVVRVAG